MLNATSADKRHVDIGLSIQEANWVLQLCRRFMNRRDEVDDIYQTALIELYRALGTARDRGTVIIHRHGFIYRVVINTLVYNYVQRTRKDLLYHALNSYDTAVLEAELVEESPLPSLDTLNLQAIVHTRLNPEERALYTLYFLDGWSQDEISRMLHVSQSTISIRCTQLKSTLRGALRYHHD